MKTRIGISFGLFMTALVGVAVSRAALIVQAEQPKTYGQKAVLKLGMQNTFTNAIESARAVVFLLDDKAKVVAQETRWIIGGAKDRPPLGPDAKTTFHFVVQSDKPFSTTKVLVTRLILEGGRSVDVNKEVQIQDAKTGAPPTK